MHIVYPFIEKDIAESKCKILLSKTELLDNGRVKFKAEF